MREQLPPAIQLHNHFSNLSPETLRVCASHFDGSANRGSHSALVDRNCREVVSQGVDELLTSLLEDIPSEKQNLMHSVGTTQDQFAGALKKDTLSCVQRLAEHERLIIVKALDIPQSTPRAICEQIYINGLDAYLSQLAQYNKLEPLAKEFRVQAGAEDAVEQIIDEIFPPPSGVAEPKKVVKPELAKRKEAPRKEAPPRPAPPVPVPAKQAKAQTAKPPHPPPPNERLSHAEHTTFIRNTRPPLQKGIALDDIQNLYWVDELRHFCREHHLKCAGKKSALNRAVFQFLNAGVVPAAAKRKAEPSVSHKAKKAKAEPQAPASSSSSAGDGDGPADIADAAEEKAAGS